MKRYVCYTELDINEMNTALGYWLWNMAVIIAPYDTGNLRRAISMRANSTTQKSIIYSYFNALYIKYLEAGQGPVKKYKGFISETTVGAFIQEIMAYFMTGKTGKLTSQPKINLKKTETSAMFYEKTLMKRLKVSGSMLTADDRRYLSRFRFGTKGRLKDDRLATRGNQRVSIHREYKLNERIFRYDQK